MFVIFLSQKGLKGDFALTGTKLRLVTLDSVLESCSKIERASGKHKNGAILPYTSQDFLGIPDDHEGVHNGGVMFLDLDYLNRVDTDAIYDSFERISAKVPWLYSIQYSSSYYLNEGTDNPKCGLHLYAKTVELDYDKYADGVGIAYAFLAAVVLKELGIDLRNCGIKGYETKVMDTSAKLSQRLFLYYSDYKVNKFCSTMDPEFVDKDTLDYLRKEYPQFMPKSKRVYKKLSEGQRTAECGTLIPRSFKHNERWKMVDALVACGMSDDEIVDTMLKIYISETGKSDSEREKTIRSLLPKARSYKLPQEVFNAGKELLESAGIVVNVNKDTIQIPKDKRIYDYSDEIKDFIDKNHRTIIVAGTGTGKTTLINGSSEWNVRSLASELNAVVVVPYLANNKLYSSMVEVSSLNSNSVPEDKPCVMVIDQAVKHFREIQNRTIIIDESHQLFLDRSFRERAAALILLLNSTDTKVICFTATPTGEVDILGLKKMEFSNFRQQINILVQDTDSIEYSELKCINAAMRKGYYDRVILFDSHSAKKIYEWEIVNPEFAGHIAYLRSETKGTPDFNEVCDTQTLTKKLTICTPVAFNGLNFNNENERILVVGSIRQNDTTPAEIIQYIGRVRNSKVTVRLFYNSEASDNSHTVEELRDKAIVYDELIRKLDITPNPFVGLYDPQLLAKDFTDAKISVDRYRRNYPTYKEVIDELVEWDYIALKVANDKWIHGDGSTHGVPQLRLKKKMVENEEFIRLMHENGEDILQLEFDSDYVINYKQEWLRKMKGLLKYEGISFDSILKMIDAKKKGSLIETVLDKLNEIVNITSIPEQEWKRYIENVEQVKQQLPQQYVKDFLRKHKHNITIRKTYAGKVYAQDETITFTDLFDELLKEQETMTEEANKKRGDIHKKPIEFKTPAYLPTRLKPFGGKKFGSCSEAAAAIGCSDDTITNYLKKGYCIET